MEKKKASLERKRPLLLSAGLVVAVSLSLVSFEWRTPYQTPQALTPAVEEPETVWIPVTLSQPEKKLEKPAPPPVERPTQIEIVDEVKADKTQFEPLVLSKENLPTVTGPIALPAEKEAPEQIQKPLPYASIMPEYCGGEQAMFDFLSDELDYPDIPRRNGISGTVYIEFVVGKDGSLRDAKVKRPVDPWLDAEALRVAKMLTCFTPGQQGGKNVPVIFVLPIRFSLGG